MPDIFLIITGFFVLVAGLGKLLFEEMFRAHMGEHPVVLPRSECWHWQIGFGGVLTGIALLLAGWGG